MFTFFLTSFSFACILRRTKGVCMNSLDIIERETNRNQISSLPQVLPLCPLCGEEKSALVNCGAHEKSFYDRRKLKNAANKLFDLVGQAALQAYDSEEMDCFVCPQCRSAYSQSSSFCPLYVLYQGIYAFLEEQKSLHQRNEAEAMKLLWNKQSDGNINPNSVLHRFRITSALDENQSIPSE